jgi:hypothetical protein
MGHKFQSYTTYMGHKVYKISTKENRTEGQSVIVCVDFVMIVKCTVRVDPTDDMILLLA